MADLETVAVPPPGEASAVPSRYATRAAASPHTRQAQAPAQAKRTMSANLSMVAPEDGSTMRPDYMQRWVASFRGAQACAPWGIFRCGAMRSETPCRSVGCCAAGCETCAMPCGRTEMGANLVFHSACCCWGPGPNMCLKAPPNSICRAPMQHDPE